IICVADAEKADVVDALGERAAQKIVVIHNGIELPPILSLDERRAAREAFDVPQHATVGAYVGALDDDKDPLTAVLTALEVARDAAPFILLVAGDGPLRSVLEDAARGRDTVRFLGFRPDVRRVLAAADFLVLPSRREGLSYALLEAMS